MTKKLARKRAKKAKRAKHGVPMPAVAEAKKARLSSDDDGLQSGIEFGTKRKRTGFSLSYPGWKR
jgi:hypothetical protein